MITGHQVTIKQKLCPVAKLKRAKLFCSFLLLNKSLHELLRFYVVRLLTRFFLFLRVCAEQGKLNTPEKQ